MAAPTSNDLICFTNCFLPQEDGNLIEKDLWIDERRGVILDAQVGRLAQAIDVYLGQIQRLIVFSEPFSCARSARIQSLILGETS